MHDVRHQHTCCLTSARLQRASRRCQERQHVHYHMSRAVSTQTDLAYASAYCTSCGSYPLITAIHIFHGPHQTSNAPNTITAHATPLKGHADSKGPPCRHYSLLIPMQSFTFTASCCPCSSCCCRLCPPCLHWAWACCCPRPQQWPS